MSKIPSYNIKRIPSYDTYVKNYMSKANQLAKHGYSMYSEMYSANEYYTQYISLRNDQVKQVMQGKRKRAANVMRDLINDQAYQFSKKQAEKQMEVAKQFGYKTTVNKLMVGDPGLKTIIDQQVNLLKEQGYSNKEIHLIISQEYFGSP